VLSYSDKARCLGVKASIFYDSSWQKVNSLQAKKMDIDVSEFDFSPITMMISLRDAVKESIRVQ